MTNSDLLERVQLLYQAQSFVAAEKYATEAVAADPDDCNAWLCLAYVRVQLEKRAEATEACDESLRCHPDNEYALHLRAAFYSDARDWPNARALAKQALKTAPDNPDHHWLMARICVNTLQNKQAIDHADRALSLDPNHVNAINTKGDALLALRRKRAARDCYKQAMRINPESQSTKFKLGFLAETRGKRRDAETFYRSVLLDNASHGAARKALLRVSLVAAIRDKGFIEGVIGYLRGFGPLAQIMISVPFLLFLCMFLLGVIASVADLMGLRL